MAKASRSTHTHSPTPGQIWGLIWDGRVVCPLVRLGAGPRLLATVDSGTLWRRCELGAVGQRTAAVM